MSRNFLTFADVSRQDIERLFDMSRRYKARRRLGEAGRVLDGRRVGLFFRKPSTRTRVSFEVAVLELGGQPIYLSGDMTQVSRGEEIKDTACVLSRYLDGLVVRTFAHKELEEFARWASVPVVNALTDFAHPCQALADYFTILEKRGSLSGLVLAYVGDANNVCNSLIEAACLLGVSIRVASPPEFGVAADVAARGRAAGVLTVTEDPAEAVEGAHVVYTDTWVSMGDEAQRDRRLKAFSPYQVNSALLARADRDVLFMHCLPAHRGQEVTSEVLDGTHSVVFDQAENRLHCQKALLDFLYS